MLNGTSLNAVSTAILRNFNTVPLANLCRALRCNEAELVSYAALMGLRPRPESDVWIQRGYLTIIRNNWNLLPKEQIVELLGITLEKLETLLQEKARLASVCGFCLRTQRSRVVWNGCKRSYRDFCRSQTVRFVSVILRRRIACKDEAEFESCLPMQVPVAIFLCKTAESTKNTSNGCKA